MTDLYVGIAVSAAMAAGLCALGLWGGRRLPRWAATVWIVLLVGFLFVHAYVLVDDLRVARWLPVAPVMVVGNFSPLAVGLIVGLAWRLVPGKVWRKGFVLVPMATICLYKAYAPATVEVPVLGDRWDHGVCRQTSKWSCSAAAAATLLRMHGIQTTEQEMAELCRTSTEGTSMLGLYRGLKLKTEDTLWDVEVFWGTVEDLQKVRGPAIVSVGLRAGQAADPRYASEWGWTPGVKHTVVAFGYDPRREEFEIADPNVGRERWSVADLRTLWHGEGLRVVLRK